MPKLEKAKLFTVSYSKIMTTISTGDEVLNIATTIFDTVAGPNLVYKDALPTARLAKRQPMRASIRKVCIKTSKVEGIIGLEVNISD